MFQRGVRATDGRKTGRKVEERKKQETKDAGNDAELCWEAPENLFLETSEIAKRGKDVMVQ